jgi:hypothetical protein
MMITLDRSDARRISAVLYELRELTNTFRQPLLALTALMTMRVFFLVGSPSPWRLVEVLESRYGRIRLIMHFDTLERLRAAIEERLAWQRADEDFVARHLSTPGNAVSRDWVPSKDFDLIFGADRERIRRETCTTAATHVVTFGMIQG